MENQYNNIIKSIILSGLIMILTLFFFIPLITEEATISSTTRQAENAVKKIKLTREYYLNNIVKDVKKFAPELSFSYNHEGVNGRLPLPTTLIHDLSKVFSENTGMTYKLYSEYPFKNRASRVLTSFQKEAIKYTKKNPKGVYVKRDLFGGKEVLRVATTDFMTSKSCVSCHNEHPDRTWKKNHWKLGDKRGIIEVIIPIEEELEANSLIRNYILIFLFIILLIVLSFLSIEILNNQKVLKEKIASKSKELDTLSTLVNEKMIGSQTDTHGTITTVSEAFIKISGYTREELLGKPHSIVRHPNMSKKMYENLWNTLKSGNPWSGDILNLAKDGSSYFVHSTIFPNIDEDKKIIGYTSFREDITKKVLIEKELEKERVFNKIILNNQDEILLISSFSKGMISLNQQFFNLFNYQDFNDFKIQHQCICELFIYKEGYLKKRNEGGYWSDAVLEKPNEIHKALMYNRYGDECIFRVRVKEIVVAEEKYHITTFSNITELEHARELAESSEKAKAAFMANMSHELRTPLNGIDGFTQLLAKTELDKKQKKYISLISTSSSNLIGIVNDILDFSKIESGKMNLSSIEIDPFIEFNNILELFNAKTKEKNITYSKHIDSNIPVPLMIDKLRISQILTNLIGNAIKFTPQDGKIDVHVDLISMSNDIVELKFSVKDSGIGIPKNRQKSIFEAFTQADDSTTREFGGTGLGLNISVSMVELMGGKLNLQSEEGKGSIFYFNVQLNAVENHQVKSINSETASKKEPLNTETTAQESEIEIKKTKILVVEDNEMNQILMDELLKQYNITADFVVNGEEAIFKVSEVEYDLIFMDINMPVLNGIDTTKFIRSSENMVPIIALTANALEGDEKKFLEAGMNDYLAKPLEYENFDRIIKKYLT